MRVKSGEYRWLRTQGQAIMNDVPRAIRMIGAINDITESKIAEQALRESERRLTMLMSNLPGMAYRWQYAGGIRMDFVSEGCVALTGYQPHEFVGTMLGIDIAHPDDLRMLQVITTRAIRSREPFQKTYRIRTASGQEKVVWEQGRGVYDENGKFCAVEGFICDITGWVRAEESLRESREQLSLVLEANKDAYWDADWETGALASSPRWAEMLGYDPGELTQTNLNFSSDAIASVHPDDLAKAMKLFQDHIDGVTPYYESEHRVKTKSGDYIWILDRGKIVKRNAEGKPVRVTGTHTDITARKKGEEERRQLDLSVQQAQKLESLGVLAGGIAHDFNNLLMGILGNAGLVLMDLVPESPARDSVHQIEVAAQRAADLARQMLAYSGRGAFVRQVINLNVLVEEMAHLLEVSISKRSVLKFHFAHNLPAVEADVTQIRQVVMNLITNASESIGENSGIVTLSTGAITVDRDYLANTYLHEDLPEGFYTYLEVSDTGLGMDAETRSKIFDPFFTTKFTGRGLGLAAVLGIIRGHKGAIRVYSELGRGTTMKVLLPATSGTPEAEKPSDGTEGRLRGTETVLIIDDEDTVRAVAKRMLNRYGYSALTARDGVEGVELFAQNKDSIDLVLLDMTMPRMSGEETYQELRRVAPSVRVILSSGYNEQEATSRFAGKGLAGYIQKPYSPQTLAEKIRETLRV